MSSRATRYRYKQSLEILITSVAVIPYSYYTSYAACYIKKVGYKKYTEYTRQGIYCDSRNVSEIKYKFFVSFSLVGGINNFLSRLLGKEKERVRRYRAYC
jgi:hypothetical protein